MKEMQKKTLALVEKKRSRSSFERPIKRSFIWALVLALSMPLAPIDLGVKETPLAFSRTGGKVLYADEVAAPESPEQPEQPDPPADAQPEEEAPPKRDWSIFEQAREYWDRMAEKEAEEGTARSNDGAADSSTGGYWNNNAWGNQDAGAADRGYSPWNLPEPVEHAPYAEVKANLFFALCQEAELQDLKQIWAGVDEARYEEAKAAKAVLEQAKLEIKRPEWFPEGLKWLKKGEQDFADDVNSKDTKRPKAAFPKDPSQRPLRKLASGRYLRLDETLVATVLDFALRNDLDPRQFALSATDWGLVETLMPKPGAARGELIGPVLPADRLEQIKKESSSLTTNASETASTEAVSTGAVSTEMDFKEAPTDQSDLKETLGAGAAPQEERQAYVPTIVEFTTGPNESAATKESAADVEVNFDGTNGEDDSMDSNDSDRSLDLNGSNGSDEQNESEQEEAETVGEGLVTAHPSEAWTPWRISFRENEEFRAASTIKLPLAVMIADGVEAGLLQLDDSYELTEADYEPSNGITEGAEIGTAFTLGELVETMLHWSDNSAFHLLARAVPNYLNEGEGSVYDIMEERYALQNYSESNHVTPAQERLWLEDFYLKLFQGGYYQELANYLSTALPSPKQELQNLLGKELHVYNKYGEYAGYFHFSGVAQGPYNVCYVVMTSNSLYTREPEVTEDLTQLLFLQIAKRDGVKVP